MSRRVPNSPFDALPRLAAIGALATLAAACSSDTIRLADNPFSNPFGSSERVDQRATGSIQPAPMQQQAIQSQPLAPITSSSLAPPSVISAPAEARSAAVQPRPQSQPVAGGPAGWSSAGGTPVVLAQGESVNTLSNRYGVPASAILSANGLTSAAQVQPGQRLVIPVYNSSGGAVAQSHVVPAAPRAAAAQVTARPSPPPVQRVASLQPTAPVASLRPAAATPVATPKPAPAPVAAKPAPEKAQAAAPEPKATAPTQMAALAPEKQAEPERASAAPSETGAFRWPARGRVIAGFSGKGGNEGINIALPEGTPVKAAEGGTVAYAGNELKGYGNLVLIRHDNGFVSAYAHNGEINVKRGDKVTRGQTIAKSGQTGNVSSPQLHFELRKGATPVDPMQHLSGS